MNPSNLLRVLVIGVALIPICSFGNLQLYDSFADGNYTVNPVWSPVSAAYPWTVSGSNGIYSVTPSGKKPWDMLNTGMIPVTSGAFKVSVRVKFNSATVQAEGLNQFQVYLIDSQNSNKGYTLSLAQGSTANSGIKGGSKYLYMSEAYTFPTTDFVTVEWLRSASGAMRVMINGKTCVTGTDTSFDRFDRVFLGVTAQNGTDAAPSPQTVAFTDVQISTSLNSIFFDNFADGNYTANPTWGVANALLPWSTGSSNGKYAVIPSGKQGWDFINAPLPPITSGIFKVSAKVKFDSATVQAEGMNQFQIYLLDSQNNYRGYTLSLAQGSAANSGVHGGSNYLYMSAPYTFPTTDFVAVDWIRNGDGFTQVLINGVPYVTGTDTTFSRFDRIFLGVTAQNGTPSAPSSQTVTFTDIQVSSSLTSSVELPVDRFDEYITGALPPYPWKTLGTLSAGASLSLQQAGESPFINNLVSGKGLVMNDTSAAEGQGCGIAYDFAPPPPGRLYLGFDFKTIGSIQAGSGLDFVCELTDDMGKGLILHLGNASALSAGPADGSPVQLASLVSNRWYHVAIDIAADQTATLSLKDSTTQAVANLGTVTFSSPGGMGAFSSLRFYGAGPAARTGGWALDNVCMAGEVEASREAWRPFNKNSVSQLRSCARKVYAYYFPVYPSSYSDTDPGLSWYTRCMFNPSMCPSDRIGAGTEILFRPLPRPRMASGLSPSEVLIKAMEEEVRLAIQMGVDGFFTDFQSQPNISNGTQTFNDRSFALMEAAERVDPDFKIIPAIYSGSSTAQQYAECATVVNSLTDPQALTLPDGRAVFSLWGSDRCTTTWWNEVFSRLGVSGIPTAFLGQVNGPSSTTIDAYAPLCYGMADWGPRSPLASYHWVPRIRGKTTVTISPTVFQDVRTRNCLYWESHNSETFRMLWNLAMSDSSDWAFIDTWSDYTEQAQAPSTSIGYAFYDLNAYYIQWFKTGQQPPIVRDVIYYDYRRHHSTVNPGKGAAWTVQMAGGIATTNEIEMLAFLKAPATLQVTVGGQTYTQEAAAGIASFKVPLPAGQSLPPPVFSVIRNNKAVLSGQGRNPIVNQVEYQNLLYHAGVISGN